MEVHMVERLNDGERGALLAGHPAWTHDPVRDAITRECRFADFGEAFAFMTRVAIMAEVQDHHPEWSNVYNRVTITLTTHDADGLSARDARMAASIDALLAG
jgi:4a-hydroxytetrahydrobiopterin dehydratase